MLSITRRALVVLLGMSVIGGLSALQLLGRNPVFGQLKAIKVATPAPPAGGPVPPGEEQPGDPNDVGQGIQLLTDSKLKNKVEAARDYIRDKNWPNATHLLQGILDLDQDALVEVATKGANGKESTKSVSAKIEANRLIGTMPAEGLDHYKTTIGPRAQAELKEAIEKSDKSLLAQIAQRYLYTDAGGEAMSMLSTYLLDRGDFTLAALSFERLIGRDGVDKLPPLTLFKAALAFHAAGDKDNKTLVLKELESRGSEGVRLGNGGQTLAMAEVRDVLNKFQTAKAPLSRSDWMMYGGDATHAAKGIGSTPFMSRRFGASMFRGSKENGTVATWLFNNSNGAVHMLENLNQPILPAFFPIAVTVRGDKAPKSMIIYRNYWGINAVDIKTGKLLWDSPSEWSLEKMVDPSDGKGSNPKPDRLNALNSWIESYVRQNTKPSIVFDNSTVGTLSSDGARVYMVEDFAVPPPFIQNPNMGWGGQPPNQNGNLSNEIREAIQHSKLHAYNIETGSMVWRLGGKGDEGKKAGPKDPNNEVKDSYFLGPPLPLGGKLYVLTEKNQELRLVAIDAAKGDVVWTQALANTREKMQQDINRRIQATLLAYGDGILVCPTNSGAILGVDLLSHSLLWAYPYREKTKEENNGGMGFPGGAVRWGPGMGGPASNPMATDWKVSAPIIVDGKVVFTAPDASAVHCIDLRKGTMLWREKKLDSDLFLGGVYNGKVMVVGKTSVRALNLTEKEKDENGKEKENPIKLWEVQTGMPSGQGVASDNYYYLPLKSMVTDKAQPAICKIELDKGKISNTKARKKPGSQSFEVPGNLLMFEGDVLSQGLSEVTAYPQLSIQIAQAEQLLAKNPKDPVGLEKRGELRLDEGKRIEAVNDLHAALANAKPDDEIVPQAKLKLYESLTELMQEDFPAAEPYLDEYQKLCNFEITETDPKKQPEQTAEKERRMVNFYCLLAKGREAKKEYTQAFQAYMDFIALTGNKKDDLVSTADQPTVRSNPDVWAQGRIAAMMANATGPAKQPLENTIAAKWNEAKGKGDLVSLRQFVAMFGSQFAVGREARLQLAERLMEEQGTASLLDAERQLILLQDQQDDASLAARAVETYARLLTRKGMLAEAAYQYKILGRAFPTTVIRDSKTGAEFYDDLATDKRFLPFLDGPRFVMTGKLQAKAESGQFPQNQQLFTFENDGEPSPYFEQHKLAFNLNFQQLKITDRTTGEEKWSPRLNNNNWFQQFLWNNGMSDRKRFPYQHVGHLVVLNMGQMIFGLDPINKQVLWEKNLLGAQGMPMNGQTQLWLDPNDETINILYNNTGFRECIGHLGQAEASYIALLTRDGLTALDPISGRILWTRNGIGARSHVFGDCEHIFVVEVTAEGQQGKAYALRAADGVKLEKVPEFSELYSQRLRLMGRRILLSQALTEATPEAKAPEAKATEAKATESKTEAKPAKDEKPTKEVDSPKPGTEKPKADDGSKPADKPAAPAKPAPTKLVIRLYDIPTGKDVWKKEFPAGSMVIRSDERDLVGAVEPDGKVALYDLRSLKADKPMFEAKVDPKYVKNVNSAQLFEDSRNFYVALNVPIDVTANPGGMSYPNIQPQTGMRSTPVNGEVYAFDRATGKMNWHNEVLQNMLLVDHFKDLPMLLFTARNNRPAPKGGGWGGQDVIITSIDKQTGKRIFDRADMDQNSQQFYAMNVDLKNGRIELVGWNYRLVHTVAPETAPAAEGGTKKEGGAAQPAPVKERGGLRAVPPPPPPAAPAKP